ncbi:transposase family protein [Pseudomonas aeruginosa]|nr:transposase family protein [Pseudomonas aeruginosa]
MDRHIANSHSGCNALLASLQREFWILSGRRTVRSVLFRCLPCYRLKASTMQPQMGDLPPDRVKKMRPFSGVGTDFAGPFMIKASRLRNVRLIKAYLCVFVCLSTKAVHLEVVADLTTEAFIASLDRFVSRRGLPELIRSDNGTNFVGADRYLRDVVNFLNNNQVDIETALSRRGIRWTFSPPGCPHWGGIFEAVVKSAKTHLMRVIGQTSLTFEELTTVFCRIEAVLNSRPLCPLSSDPHDLESLTPGHFLIGQPLNALPEYPLSDIKPGRLRRYQMLQQMSQDFWKRWSLEYLHLLQQRFKWTDRTSPPHVGDLVLVKDANLPPLRWRRGRIVNLFPGKDGTPRSAEVLVGDSVLKRAVTTLSRLPVD